MARQPGNGYLFAKPGKRVPLYRCPTGSRVRFRAETLHPNLELFNYVEKNICDCQTGADIAGIDLAIDNESHSTG